MSINNLLYLLTKLLPKVLEVGSSKFAMADQQKYFFSPPHTLPIYKRKKIEIVKWKRKQGLSEKSTL